MSQLPDDKSSQKQNIQNSSIKDSRINLAQLQNGKITQVQTKQLIVQLSKNVIPFAFKKHTKPSLRRGLICLSLSCLTAIGLTLQVRKLGWLESSELWAYDRFMQLQLMQLQSVDQIDQKILIIAVNDEDIKKFKKPLSDRLVTQLLNKLVKYQPRVIGLNILRDEASGKKTDWENLGIYIQNSAIPIIPICRVGETNRQPKYLQAKKPPPRVASESLGFSDSLMEDLYGDPRDPDKIIRRYSLVMGLREKSPCSTPYSFGFQIVRNYLPPQTKYSYEAGNKLQINSIDIKTLQSNFGGYRRSKNWMLGYQILINYHPPEKIAKEVSLTSIMNALDSDLQELIQNRIVLIGYTRTNGNDYHSTPIGQLHGIKIHAQIINQIIDIVSNKQPLLSSWSNSGEIIWIFGCSIIGGFFTCLFQSLQRLTIVTLLELLGICIICYISFIYAIWIPFVPALLSLITTTYFGWYIIRTSFFIKEKSCVNK